MVSSCRRIAKEGHVLEPKVGQNACGPEKDSFIHPTDLTISNSQVLHSKRTYPLRESALPLTYIYDALFSGLRCTCSMQERLHFCRDMQKCLCFLVRGWVPVTSNLNFSFSRIDAGRIFVRKVVTDYTLWYELALHTATCLQPTPNTII